DRPGVTVDRLESDCMIGQRPVILVDTGGIGEPQHGEMQPDIDAQVEAALAVADLVLFVVDGQTGATPVDHDIAERLRRQGLPVMLVVNKAEQPGAASDFYALGLDEPAAVSAAHGQGIADFIERLQAALPPETERPAAVPEEEQAEPLAQITVIGRPNVGKSTLINAWLGRERVVVSPIAGTTRDAIDVDMPYRIGDQEGAVRLVDTAGQRKHGRISDIIEFVARVKAVQAFRRAHAAVVVLDGSEGVSEQDMRLMTLAQQEGCALLVAVNKADLMSDEQWSYFSDRLSYRMRAMPDVPVFRISAKKGRGVKRLLGEAVRAARNNGTEINTGSLNRWLEEAQRRQTAPSERGAVVRLKYAFQIDRYPPTIKVFCNRPGSIKASYLRYLEQSFRSRFQLPGIPVRFAFTASENPYAPAREAGRRAKRKA
ncbi:MAG TPA: ribosome biogenesis GTPase Der, partial [Mariprofundaceae bacterium]|nr:ribosome biogenesis GTPase Der [Mariprofundaceae bacterium]